MKLFIAFWVNGWNLLAELRRLEYRMPRNWKQIIVGEEVGCKAWFQAIWATKSKLGDSRTLTWGNGTSSEILSHKADGRWLRTFGENLKVKRNGEILFDLTFRVLQESEAFIHKYNNHYADIFLRVAWQEIFFWSRGEEMMRQVWVNGKISA